MTDLQQQVAMWWWVDGHLGTANAIHSQNPPLDFRISVGCYGVIIKYTASMIDLSKFVGKRVCLTLRDGSKRERTVCESIWNVYGDETFCLSEKPGNPLYSSSGIYLSDPKPYADIIEVEELTMKEYERLEKKVAKLQKEIDRLKREERCPSLKSVEITRTVHITPEQYLKHCEENDEHPTVKGYEEYYSCWRKNWYRFVDRDTYAQEIKVVED